MASKSPKIPFEFKSVSIDKLKVHPENQRLNDAFNKRIKKAERELLDKRLKGDIEAHGQLNPIIINRKYEIISGYRRFQISKQLGAKEVRCQILSTENAKQEKAIIIRENTTQRPIEGSAWIAVWETYYDRFDERAGKASGKRGVSRKSERADLLTSKDIADDFQVARSTVRGIIRKYLEDQHQITQARTTKPPERVPISDASVISPIFSVFEDIIGNIRDIRVIDDIKARIGKISQQIDKRKRELLR